MKLHQNISTNLKFIYLPLILLLTIIIASNYNNALATNFADMIFDSIGESLGINIDKIDKSYNNVTISNNIITSLAKNMYYQNNNIIASNVADLPDDNQQFDICGHFMQHFTTSKQNKKTQDYSHITHSISSINTDTNMGKLINFGCGYSFTNTKLKVYERKNKQNLGTAKVATHVAILYAYSDFSIINTHITLMGATSKHHIEPNAVKANYNSKFFSANLISEIDTNLLLFSIHVLFNLGVAKVYSDKTTINKIAIPKGSNKLFNLGLSFTTFNKLDIKLMQLSYRFSVGYQLSHINDNIISASSFFLNPTKPPLNITESAPSMHNLIAEANLALQIYRTLQFGLNLNYMYGNKTDEYGFAASISYIF